MLTYRPYQRSAIDATHREFARGAASTLGVMATGCGKAQPLDSGVLTPSGFVRMGEIRVGDDVIGRDGRAWKVTGVFPQGELQTYRVAFDDGTSTRCCGSHLWAVRTKSQKCRGQGYSVLRTDSILRRGVVDRSGAAKWFVPLVEPVQFDVPLPRPVDPYVLGILLGDGCLTNTSVCFSSADEYVVRRVAKSVPFPCRVRHVENYDYRITVGRTGSVNPLRQSLLSLGLLGHGAESKFVPLAYKRADVATRLEVLRGLMDSDGHVRPAERHVEFSTVSRRLADDVVDIVRSLGGATRVREKSAGTYTYKGENRTGRKSFRVTITLDGLNVFALPRKAELYKHGKNQGQTKAIVSIEADAIEQCQCIAIDAPDRLYVTDGYTVTHNTIYGTGVAFERRDLGRTLILSHRDELVWQWVRAVRRVFGDDVRPDVQAGEERGDLFTKNSPVVVSTVQTQYSGQRGQGRMSLFDPMEFATLVVDEAHHYIAPAFRRVVDYYRKNPNLRVLGLTATPDRADRLAMGRLFQTVACNYDLKWATDPGVSWLVPIDQYTGRIADLDLSDVEKSRGDLNAEQLSNVMTRTGVLHGVVEHTLRRVGDRRTIVFAVPGSSEVDEKQVKHAELLTAIFNKAVPPRNGIPQAYFVHQKTPTSERRAMFKAYAAGAFQFLVNVGIATEGFDDAGAECCVVARPTMSRSLYTQMAGRVTRPLPGTVDLYPADDQGDDRRVVIAESSKPCCELIDFEGNAGRHKLITGADILGGDYDSEVIAKAKRKSLDAADAGEAKDLRDLLEASRLEVEREKRERAERLAELRVRSQCLFQEVDPYDHSGSNVPSRRKNAGIATGARNGPPSPSQLSFLAKHAKDVDPGTLTMGEAGKIVGDIKRRFKAGLCSRAQSKVLARYGLPPEVPRDTARHWLDRLAANKWRVPPDVRKQAFAAQATKSRT